MTYINGYEYYSRLPHRPFGGPISTRFSDRERGLRHAVALFAAKRTREAESALFVVARVEARVVTRSLGLELEGDDLAAIWMTKNLAAFLRGADAAGSLLARLKRGLRSRGIDEWRAEYAKKNPLAQYYFVRFAKVVRHSSSLVERGGYVTLRSRRHLPPGDPQELRADLISPRPEAPQRRAQRLRSTRGAEAQYVPFMEACLTLSGGKLKRRALAELLAEAHGEARVLPGYRGERFDASQCPDENLPLVEGHAEEDQDR